MSKYVRVFNNHTDYQTYINSNNALLPNVSCCVEEDDVHYNSIYDYSQDYLTIKSRADNNTIGFKFDKRQNNDGTKTISVSTDEGATWTEFNSLNTGTTIATLNAGDKLLIKGLNDRYSVEGGFGYYNYFTTTDEIDVSGNIMSLIYGDNFIGQTRLNYTYAFFGLFSGNYCEVVNAKNLILPATTLTDNCYEYMFDNCTSLTTAPELPATTLAYACYNSMFHSCTNLTTAPELPATTLASRCYSSMFQNCQNIVNAPDLMAITLAVDCYFQMFYSCDNLQKEANLPSIYTPSNKLSEDYCSYMYGDTNLRYNESTSIYEDMAYEQAMA